MIHSLPIILLLFLGVSGCGHETEFVTVAENNPEKSDRAKLKNPTNGRRSDVDHNEVNDAPDEPIVMNFVQGPSRGVDILWIIDNSVSMRPLQVTLRENISSFIGQLSASNLDFQLGITSTDICFDLAPRDISQVRCPEESPRSTQNHQGSLVGTSGDRVLTTATPNLIAKFRDYANLGTRGSSFEHGLSAAKLAVEKSLAGQNENFLRENSFLSVIIVSDEDDDGVGLSKIDEDGVNYHERGSSSYYFDYKDLTNYLDSVLGNGNFSVSAIVGLEKDDSSNQNSTCRKTGSRVLEIGEEYIKAAQQSGGILSSICQENWASSLQEIGRDIESQMSTVQLTKIPDLSTLTVYVEGFVWESWDYIAGTNSIKFRPNEIPAAGSRIQIKYYQIFE